MGESGNYWVKQRNLEIVQERNGEEANWGHGIRDGGREEDSDSCVEQSREGLTRD